MKKLSTFELVLLPLFGALMVAGDVMLEFLPNVHLVGVILTVATLTFRAKALISLYVYVFLIGLLQGFGFWWLPYLYIWLFLWGTVMLLPKNPEHKFAPFLYALVCGGHGLLFGLLYSPAQLLLFDFDVTKTLLWVSTGFLTADVPHAAANFVFSLFLTVPLTRLILRLKTRIK